MNPKSFFLLSIGFLFVLIPVLGGGCSKSSGSSLRGGERELKSYCIYYDSEGAFYIDSVPIGMRFIVTDVAGLARRFFLTSNPNSDEKKAWLIHFYPNNTINFNSGIVFYPGEEMYLEFDNFFEPAWITVSGYLEELPQIGEKEIKSYCVFHDGENPVLVDTIPYGKNFVITDLSINAGDEHIATPWYVYLAKDAAGTELHFSSFDLGGPFLAHFNSGITFESGDSLYLTADSILGWHTISGYYVDL